MDYRAIPGYDPVRHDRYFVARPEPHAVLGVADDADLPTCSRAFRKLSGGLGRDRTIDPALRSAIQKVLNAAIEAIEGPRSTGPRPKSRPPRASAAASPPPAEPPRGRQRERRAPAPSPPPRPRPGPPPRPGGPSPPRRPNPAPPPPPAGAGPVPPRDFYALPKWHTPAVPTIDLVGYSAACATHGVTPRQTSPLGTSPAAVFEYVYQLDPQGRTREEYLRDYSQNLRPHSFTGATRKKDVLENEHLDIKLVVPEQYVKMFEQAHLMTPASDEAAPDDNPHYLTGKLRSYLSHKALILLMRLGATSVHDFYGSHRTAVQMAKLNYHMAMAATQWTMTQLVPGPLGFALPPGTLWPDLPLAPLFIYGENMQAADHIRRQGVLPIAQCRAPDATAGLLSISVYEHGNRVNDAQLAAELGFTRAAWFFSDMNNPVGFIPAGKLDGYHYCYTDPGGASRLRYYPDTSGPAYDTLANHWSGQTGTYVGPGIQSQYAPFDAVNLNPELARQGGVTFLLIGAAPVIVPPVSIGRPATVEIRTAPDPRSYWNYLFGSHLPYTTYEFPVPIALWSAMVAKFCRMTMSNYLVSSLMAEAVKLLIAYPHWAALVTRLSGDLNCPYKYAFENYPSTLAHAVIAHCAPTHAQSLIYSQRVAAPAARSAQPAAAENTSVGIKVGLALLALLLYINMFTFTLPYLWRFALWALAFLTPHPPTLAFVHSILDWAGSLLVPASCGPGVISLWTSVATVYSFGHGFQQRSELLAHLFALGLLSSIFFCTTYYSRHRARARHRRKTLFAFVLFGLIIGNALAHYVTNTPVVAELYVPHMLALLFAAQQLNFMPRPRAAAVILAVALVQGPPAASMFSFLAHPLLAPIIEEPIKWYLGCSAFGAGEWLIATLAGRPVTAGILPFMLHVYTGTLPSFAHRVIAHFVYNALTVCLQPPVPVPWVNDPVSTDPDPRTMYARLAASTVPFDSVEPTNFAFSPRVKTDLDASALELPQTNPPEPAQFRLFRHDIPLHRASNSLYNKVVVGFNRLVAPTAFEPDGLTVCDIFAACAFSGMWFDGLPEFDPVRWPTQAEWIAHMPRDKQRLYHDVFVTLNTTPNPCDANGPVAISSVQVNVKGDEKLVAKTKFRPIHAVSPVGTALSGQAVYASTQEFKQLANGEIHSLADGDYSFFFASSATPKQFSEWYTKCLEFASTATRPFLAIAVAGDDVLIIAYLPGLGLRIYEIDASSFDHSQTLHGWDLDGRPSAPRTFRGTLTKGNGWLGYELWLIDHLGMAASQLCPYTSNPYTVTEILACSYVAPLRLARHRSASANFEPTQFTIKREYGERLTGGVDTTFGNSATSMQNTYHRFKLCLQAGSFEPFTAPVWLGISMKVRETQTPTFLKGIMLPALDGSFVWTLLPSRLLKMATSIKNPRVLFKQSPAPDMSLLSSIATGYLFYPMVPPMHALMHSWASLSRIKRPIEEFKPWMQPSTWDHPPHCPEAFELLAQHYECDPALLLDYFEKFKEFKPDQRHPLWQYLTQDYATCWPWLAGLCDRAFCSPPSNPELPPFLNFSSAMSADPEVVLSEQRMPRKARAILAKLVAARQLTPEGLVWLFQSLDGFHDTELPATGLPDGQNSRSLVQTIRRQMIVTAPVGLAAGAKFDARIDITPLTQCYTTTAPQDCLVAALVVSGAMPAGTPGTQQFFPGVTVHTLPSVDPFISNLGSHFSLNNVALPLSNAPRRIVSVAFEAVNTTPALYRGGTVMAYRTPTAMVEGVASAGIAPFAPVANLTVAMGLPITFADITKDPRTLTWGAEEGAYVNGAFYDVQNMPFPQFDNKIAVLATRGVNYNGDVCFARAVQGGGTYDYRLQPIHYGGAWFSGLDANTTLQVTVKYTVEDLLNVQEANFPLTRLTPPADPVALEIYSRAVAALPVGCRVSENPLGEWFNEVMQGIADYAPGILSGIPVVGGLIGTGVGLAARAAKGINQNLQAREQREPKKKAAPAAAAARRPAPPPLPARNNDSYRNAQRLVRSHNKRAPPVPPRR